MKGKLRGIPAEWPLRGLRRLVSAALVATLAAGCAPAAGTPAGGEFEVIEKIALWDNATGPHLRGVNVSQRRNYPEINDWRVLGWDPAGPPYDEVDFAEIAAMGANVVMLTHPAPFGEAPPYELEPAMEANLARLVALAHEADLFVVIAFKTGPGRSAFSFFSGGAGDWFPESLFNDTVWASREAQDAWVAAWRHTAERFSGHPAVIGYELLLEPNSNNVGSDYLTDRLGIWEPEVFHERYGGTLYDWNQLFPRIVAAIREVDADMPLLVGGNGYSSIGFLPFVEPVPDPNMVYVVHIYNPRVYTGQKPDKPIDYPGRFDADWDEVPDHVDRAYLDGQFAPVDLFRREHGVPVGVTRWAPSADRFIGDQLAVMEARGLNHLMYTWDTRYSGYMRLENPFLFRFGPDPEHRRPLRGNAVTEVLRQNWKKNIVRPSNVTFAGSRS